MNQMKEKTCFYKLHQAMRCKFQKYENFSNVDPREEIKIVLVWMGHIYAQLQSCTHFLRFLYRNFSSVAPTPPKGKQKCDQNLGVSNHKLGAIFSWKSEYSSTLNE